MTSATSKTKAHELVLKGEAFEAFSHESLGHFNVTAARTLCKSAHDRGLLSVSRALFAQTRMVDGIATDALQYLWANRDIDQEHATRLTPVQLIEPAIVVLVPPERNGNRQESHLIIDGIHRIFRRHQLGKPEYYFYLIPMDIVPMVPNWHLEHSERMRPELDWGRLRWVGDHFEDRATGARVGDIPGIWENGRRVD